MDGTETSSHLEAGGALSCYDREKVLENVWDRLAIMPCSLLSSFLSSGAVRPVAPHKRPSSDEAEAPQSNDCPFRSDATGCGDFDKEEGRLR